MPAPDPDRVGCHYPGCDRIEVHRGLCSLHYRQAGNRVGRGETTWAALEAAGLAKPAVRPGQQHKTRHPWAG